MDRSNSTVDTGTVKRRESTLLVGVRRPSDPEWRVSTALDELARLVDSAGAEVADRLVFARREPSPGHYIGTGQAAELGARALELGVDTIVFDEDLTPAQGRNLERITEVRVVDRTQVILDIFAQRAHTAEGRLQVELAQLQYLLPRLRRMWTHLERQKGGIGLKGPGEQQIELDRRRIEMRITRIRRDLDHVRVRRREVRRGRARHGWARICLVGYTNAGKSTLLNALSDARVQTDDRLFATLDPTTRRVELPGSESALLTDTVGFIRKLPHRLVDAFRATLEEVTEADLLLHVVDASHPEAEAQIEAVEEVLAELGADTRACLPVWNKCDAPGAGARARALVHRLSRGVRISARTGEGLDELREALADRLRDRAVSVRLCVPAAEGRILALLHEGGQVHSQVYDGDQVWVEARVPRRVLGPLKPYLQGGRDDGGEPSESGDGETLPD